jgi:hypothetical protein
LLDLDSKRAKGKKIKVGGEVYDLEPPILDAMIDAAGMDGLSDRDQLVTLKGFLEKCGLPKKVSGKLDGGQIKALSDYLKDDSKKK